MRIPKPAYSRYGYTDDFTNRKAHMEKRTEKSIVIRPLVNFSGHNCIYISGNLFLKK